MYVCFDAFIDYYVLCKQLFLDMCVCCAVCMFFILIKWINVVYIMVSL